MRSLFIALALVAMTFSTEAFAAPSVGEAAPDFSVQTAKGETITLADFKGKNVVLEWTNRHCPFVKKFYKGDDMQRFQKEATAQDTVWLTVLSSAEGKQGYLTPAEALAHAEEVGAASTHLVLDPEGTFGKLYAAKTTPHMYVIDGEGMLQYAGAIDSIASADSADVAEAENYVLAALDAIAKGETPATQTTQAYGCSIKYKN